MNRYQKYRFRLCKKNIRITEEMTGNKIPVKDAWRWFKESERQVMSEIGKHRKDMKLDKIRGVVHD